jgi:hypothetical protein
MVIRPIRFWLVAISWKVPVHKMIFPSRRRSMVSFINVIIVGDMYSLVNSHSNPKRNCCRHWIRDGALHRRKCSFVSREAEHAGEHGEYLETFRLALSPTGRCLWLYFGTNRCLDVENRAELKAGQCTESYVASSQSFRFF